MVLVLLMSVLEEVRALLCHAVPRRGLLPVAGRFGKGKSAAEMALLQSDRFILTVR